MHSTQLNIHFCELQQNCFLIDQVFHFIAALGFHAPVTWVWNSICLDFRSSYNYVIFKDIYSQFDVLDAILSDIVLALYFDWIHWLHDSSLTYIYGSGNGSIYSILLGFILGL